MTAPAANARTVDDVLDWLAQIPLPTVTEEITTRVPLWLLETARAHARKEVTAP